MTKINLDFFFANSPGGVGKTYSTKKLICPFCQQEFSSWKKEGLDITCEECTDFHNQKYGTQEEIQKRKIAYYQQQASSVFLHKADQRYYKKLLLEALKHDKV